MAQGVRYRTADQPAGREQRGPDGQHSLTVRLPFGTSAESVRAHARTAEEFHPALAGLEVWHEQLPTTRDAAAVRARLRKEAQRPLSPNGRPLRAVVLTYPEGPAELVLVARRALVSGPELSDLALSLAQGQHPGPPSPPAAQGLSAAAPVPRGQPAPQWGLGDPAAGDRCGEAVIPLTGQAPPNAVLLAAVAITAARHSGEDGTALAVWSSGASSAGTGVYRAGCDERQTVHDHLAQYRTPAAGTPLDGGPQIGVVLDEDRPGEHYRPFLAPPLPVIVHWRRATDGTVTGLLGYRERDLAPQIARDFAAHLAHVLGQLVAAPNAPLGDIELFPHAETARLLAAGTGPAAPPAPADRTVHGLFSEIARRQPEAVAVVDEKTELRYAELELRAERLAAGLVALGAAPTDVIAVALERTADLVVALLGILKAGCAYLPVDLRHPPERLRYTIADAGSAIAIALPGSLPGIDGVRTIEPQELYEIGETLDGDRPLPLPAEDGSSPAYTIYTSGSTGRPKGVVVLHRNVAALVAATRTDFGLGPHDTWTLFHSCAFDFSVWEVWGCLLTGGKLVVVPSEVAQDTELFYGLVERLRVTVLNQTPSAFAQFNETDARRRGRLALRLVVFGGEPLDVGMLASWFTRHSPASCRMSNMFGITETTVHVTEQTLTPAEVVSGSRSVGRALPGWSVSVRDARGRLLPAGVAGEIHVGGAGVAQGYLHQPELTRERFITDPHGGGRLYRSGDLGRIRPDGRLDHLGRIDSQVKIRGHRIELDEIRSVLLGHPSVAAAAVALRYGTPGDRDTARIDAYYVVRGDARPTAGDLRGHAAALLPGYMLPATFTRIDALPLTANGKADLSRLPQPAPAAEPVAGDESAGTPAGAPHTAEAADPVAATVLALWRRLLNTDVGLRDNFFELGGNSLLVVRLLRELADQGLPRVGVQDFYRNSGAAQFIQLLRDARDTVGQPAPLNP
ncbi:amino acid adenylation domain-containing protein [Streptomyces shenzhenensis]|uniref:amino acid adenylation domain-containing protein n=1 Tax=Streptomyces shenzhenensis TaxID=943815 RepID=UPI0015F02C71|nr:amino acid adenylation domain-containing protein [Streptomyces shenzhenensis]